MHLSQISTRSLTVEIKALRLDGRKMTVSVFRQLPEISVLHEPYENEPSTREDLNRWGYVRHEIKDEGRLWLVAEREGRLYRCCLHIPEYTEHAMPGSKKDIALNKVRFDVLENCDQLFIAA